MSAVNPPTYVTGTYNPAFFTTSNGITTSQANALYLQKTNPDSASALETFNGGIIAGSIDVNSASNTMVLYPSMSLTQNMGIGNAGTTWTSGVPTIQIGGTTGYSVHCGGIDCQGNSINNAVSPAAGTLYLAYSQTSGILNIGTNIARTNAINIGGSTLATSTNTLTLNSTSTGLVTVGATGGSVLVVPTMSLSANLTLPVSLGTIPVAGTQLGGITSVIISGAGYSVNTNISVLNIPTIGTYSVCFSYNTPYLTIPTAHRLDIGGTAVGLPVLSFGYTSFGSTTLISGCSGSFIFRCTATGTILLNDTITGTVSNVANGFFIATRIA